MSDRFTGLVSLFLLAVATERALLIDWQGVRPFLKSPLLGDAMYVDDYMNVMKALPSNYIGPELKTVGGKEPLKDTAFNKAGFLYRWATCSGSDGVSGNRAMC